MKNFKYYLGLFALFTMLFTSCSKEEGGASVSDQDTVQLQLGALLNDFGTRQANKAHETDPTECRDAAPAYVRLGLSNDATGFFVGGPGNTDPFLIEVNIKNNNGSWETEYSDLLGLPAGDYTLEYFIVYSADDEVLWVAPRAGGDYASSVGSPLPMSIDLEAGTKPYIVVDVLCYIPRNEEAYGYIFFDIDLTTVENNYCIFVNYCYDGTGREYPAKFEVDIWADDFDGEDVVVDGAMNSVSGTGNSFAATVICMALPPLVGSDVYYVRVSVMDAGAYNADASDVREFTITQADVNAQLTATPKYEHVRINCGDDGGTGCDPEDATADCDNDGVLNGVDECKGQGVRGSVDAVGCPIVVVDCTTNSTGPTCDPDNDNLTNAEEDALGTDPNDADTDNDGVIDGNDDCPLVGSSAGQVDLLGNGCWTDPVVGCTPTTCTMSNTAGGLCYLTAVDIDQLNSFYMVSAGPSPSSFALEGNRGIEVVPLGSFRAEIVNGKVVVQIDGALETDKVKAYEVQVRPNDGTANMSSSCFHTLCASDITPTEGNQPAITLEFSAIQYEYPIFVRVKAIICEAEVAGP